ncbi:hypothetical protein B0189_01205 [Moraxella cuniculi]|nr:hypothetical protein B0189_01205 [Moraxella cuniculi]
MSYHTKISPHLPKQITKRTKIQANTTHLLHKSSKLPIFIGTNFAKFFKNHHLVLQYIKLKPSSAQR